jgi:oligoribonuclease NrnB/cAMP/cGMP phosphodiesterase (DHH superfamily)
MKTVCIYHSIDLDGWMSAAIVKHWFLKQNKLSIISDEHSTKYKEWISTHSEADSLFLLGYNHGQPIPDLSEYDKVIMCDISFPKKEMTSLYNRLNENFIWLDHHISAINDNIDVNGRAKGERAIEFAACEITWMYFFPNEEMPEIVRLLGRYDCFGHKGTDEEQKVLEFQYGARQVITNYEEAYNWLQDGILHSLTTINRIHNQGKAIYQYLCTEAKQTYKNGFEINFNQTKYHPHDGVKKFICINKERFNPINFGIDYHKDGYDGCACFHFNGKKWAFSLYNDNGEVDCSIIAKQFGGGGHKGAAGFITDNINSILNLQ